jgi:hypothetical protein
MIKAKYLEQIGSYLLHLESLIESINQLNNEKICFDSIDKYQEKIYYQWREKVMMVIYDFLPIKIIKNPLPELNILINTSLCVNNAFDKIFKTPEENIFALNDYMSKELKSILNNQYIEVFFFNYFLRNVNYHRRQNVIEDSIIGANDSLKYIMIELIISEDNHRHHLLSKMIDNQCQISLSDNKIKIYKVDFDTLSIRYSINIDKIKQLVNDIANAFRKGLYRIIKEISLINDEYAKSEFNGMTKDEVIEIITKWIKDIPKVL